MDGFNLDEERLHEMVWKTLSSAYGHEIETKVVKAPNEKEIKILQGSLECPKCKGNASECFTCMIQLT